METLPGRVDASRCNGCNACVKACPRNVLELADGRARPIAGHEGRCFRCGHCVMVCDRDAMRVDGLDPADFMEALPWGFDADALDRFLQSRRSVRRFLDKPVDRALLDRLLDLAATAPMGWPPHTTSALVLTDKAEIRRLLTVMRAGYAKMDRMTRSLLGRSAMRVFAGKENWRMLRDYILGLTREANEVFAQTGQDKYLHAAPAVIVFLGDRDGLCHDQNALLVTHAAMLAAHALGLGSTMIGLIPPIVDRSDALRKRWGIAPGQAVVSAIVVGHPAVRFVRVQRRRLADVRFV